LTSDSDRARLWNRVQNLLAVLIVGGFAFYLWRNRTLFESVLSVSPAALAGVALGIVLTWLVSSAQGWLMYRAEGLRIGFWENFLLNVAGVMVNYLPLRLGTVIRLRYLKAVHGFSYARSVSIVGIRLVLLVTATGLLGLAGTLGIAYTGGRFSVELCLAFGSLIVLAALASYRSPPISRRETRMHRIWNDFSSGFGAMRKRPVVTMQVLALILIQLLLAAWRFSLTLGAVGAEAPATLLIVLAPATTLSSFVSVVPGNLGIREALMGYITLATGFEFNSGLFAGTLDRAVLLCLAFSLGSLSFFYVWARIPGVRAEPAKDEVKKAE
jgi:uncharacterized membrane protein YbhN (UPF0104 family)